MKEFKIDTKTEGVRLDKQLKKILSGCNPGFIYKMLRKKNITLNDLKAEGGEHLKAGDVIKIYFSDETFEKFSGNKSSISGDERKDFDIPSMIVYEDESIMLINKPAGLLTQKAAACDVSLNELCLLYLLDKGELTEDKLMMFKPSVCNRLDRNTSGLVIFAKNYASAAQISEELSTRELKKFYKCIVSGRIDKRKRTDGYLIKDSETNKVRISETYIDNSAKIITEYVPLKNNDKYTLLEVELITGKSHQIRAHLASQGHPILGDVKYGDKELNRRLKEEYGTSHQMLHAYRLIWPDDMGKCLSKIEGREYKAPVPDDFDKLLKALRL